MSQIVRKAQPDCLRYFLSVLRTNESSGGTGGDSSGTLGSAGVEQLVRVLVTSGNYAKTTASETVANAFHDGLLVPAANQQSAVATASPRTRTAQEPKRARLPSAEEVTMGSHDFYCYECHLPGLLEQCRQCVRAFHRLCYRKNAERPNYTVPSSKLQKNRLPVFSSESDSESDVGTALGSTLLDYESDVRVSSSLLQLDQTSLDVSWSGQRGVEDFIVDSTSSPVIAVDESKNLSLSLPEDKLLMDDVPTEMESKTKVDVVCLGEVRPPTRKRPGTTASSISYKSEITPTDEDENDLELCTCCRLLKSAALRNPPNLKSDELCHLLGFTFSRNRDWVTQDVRSHLQSLKLTETEVALITRLLLRLPNKCLDDIELKLRQEEYNYLMEFLVDLLDVQHNIGIFFGPYSIEMESTKWLLRDVAHDLSEIRRCPDCFRYSNEKHSTVWFAKPCVQRHELVFAKHSGFPYWPAKVIRVLPNSRYDVRFFGGNHSRALIDVRHIKAIDTDVKHLKLGSSPAMKKALEELRYHQILSTYPPSIFSFHADRQETDEIIRAVLERSVSSDMVRSSRGRPKRKRASSEKSAGAAAAAAAAAEITMPSVPDSGQILTPSHHNSIIEYAYSNNICSEVSVAVKRLRISKGTPTVTSSSSPQPKRITRQTGKQSNTEEAYQIENILKDLEETRKIADDMKQRNEELESQNQKLKETIKKQELERKILKRKQWCYWCLNEAVYLCCFRAAYCSERCQARHWKDGHSKECKNRDDQRQATSTT